MFPPLLSFGLDSRGKKCHLGVWSPDEMEIFRFHAVGFEKKTKPILQEVQNLFQRNKHFQPFIRHENPGQTERV